MKDIALEVKTPEKTLFFDRVISLKVNTPEGSIGILPDHAPIATLLAAGKVEGQLASGEKKTTPGKGGFLIVKNNVATVLLDQE